MKKSLIILLLALVFCNIGVQAQRDKSKNLPKFDHTFMHFGFLLGLNSANFTIVRDAPDSPGADSLFLLESVPATGFNLGIVSAMHFGEHFSLRFTPNLAFASRSLEYTFETMEGTRQYIKTIESTLINFPLNIKYKSARVNNFSLYLVAGAAYTLDLASNEGKTNDSQDLNDVIVKIRQNDYVGEIGIGTDFYLEYFKFALEIKMSYGLNNLLDDDGTPFSTPIDRLSSKMFLLSILFEG